ncbi:hypothetical protein LCGC14_1996720 [marine sediment metagenome]|uniref:Uncharacterized protein n=1 Tax=marine sediment metagenome TaxID=412755 RepID=A0A0F9I1I9_9ZZZZ
MKGLLKLLQNKYVLYAIIFVGVLSVFKMRSCQGTESDILRTYNRQLHGQLSDLEREFQLAHHEIGVTKSKLITQEELSEKLKEENEEKDGKFSDFVKKHNLQVKNFDRTIAELKQKIDGGITTTVISDDERCNGIEKFCIIEYSWRDALGRFKLRDPNIFNEGDEVFESNQTFKIFGEIYEQKDSSLQIRRLVLKEMFKNQNGEYEPIPGGKANIVESEFNYSNTPTPTQEKSWRDLFRLRAVIVGSIGMLPNVGQTHLGFGAQFFEFEGAGINTYTAFDFEDIGNTEQRIGFSYSPNIFDLDINFAMHLSLGTSFASFFKDYSVSTGMVFYIHQ